MSLDRKNRQKIDNSKLRHEIDRQIEASTKRRKIGSGTSAEPAIYCEEDEERGIHCTSDSLVIGKHLNCQITIHNDYFACNDIIYDVYDVFQYGAVGDGVTDDLAAIQAGVDYVKLNGGILKLEGKTYAVSGTIDVGSNTKTFGIAGIGTSSEIKRISGGGTVINGVNTAGCILTNFKVNGNETILGGGNHGVAFDDSNDVTIINLTVEDYLNTGIIIFATNGPDVQYTNCLIANCIVDGKDISNNGILFEDMYYSSMINTRVYNIKQTGAPSYAIQLKDLCRYCEITNCHVSKTRGGIYFGPEFGVNDGVQYCIVSDCTIRECSNNGIGIGPSNHNMLSNIFIDMASAGNEAVRTYNGDATYKVRDTIIQNVFVLNLAAPKHAVRLGDYTQNVRVHVSYVSPNKTGLALFNGANVSKCTIEVEQVKDNTNRVASDFVGDSGTDNTFIIKKTSTVPLLAPDGTISSPGISFQNEEGRGFYLTGTGEVAMTYDGTQAAQFDDTLYEMNLPLNLKQYTTAGLPSATEGSIVYDSDKELVQYADSGGWKNIFVAPTLQTWTPTAEDESGNEPAYTLQEGSYYQLGTMVWYTLQLHLSGQGSAIGTEHVNLTLPVATTSNRIWVQDLGANKEVNTPTTAYENISAWIDYTTNGSFITLLADDYAAGVITLDWDQINYDCKIRVSGFYSTT